VLPRLDPFFQSRHIDAGTIGALTGTAAVAGMPGGHFAPTPVDRL
jgi:hypothetical protein